MTGLFHDGRLASEKGPPKRCEPGHRRQVIDQTRATIRLSLWVSAGVDCRSFFLERSHCLGSPFYTVGVGPLATPIYSPNRARIFKPMSAVLASGIATADLHQGDSG